MGTGQIVRLILTLSLLFLFDISAFCSSQVKTIQGSIVTVCSPKDINPNCVQTGSGSTILTPNVGIGTTGPTQALQVVGNVEIDSSSGGLNINGTMAGQGGIDANTLLAINFQGTNGQTSYTAETGQTVTFNSTAQISTAQFPFGTSSLFTNGTGQTAYASVPDQAGFNFGTNSFTHDFWVYFPTTVPSGGCDLANDQVDTVHVTGIWFGGSLNYIRFANYNSSAVLDFNFPFTPVANTWYYIRIVRNGNTWYAFTGTSGGTATSQTLTLTAGSYSSSLYNPASGWRYGGGVNFGGANEYIAAPRISNIARNTSTASFSVPTGVWTSANTTSSLTFSNLGTTSAQITQSTQTGNLTLTNNSIPSIVISSNGNVGVGTLNVNGVPTSGTVSSGSAGQVPYYASAGTTLSGSSNILSNGTNVSIGTAIPQVSLHQYASSGFIGNTVQSGTSSFMGTSANSLTQPTIGYDSSHDLAFGTITSNAWAGFAEKMRITSVGNVGIGSTMPTAPLYVQPTKTSGQGLVRALKFGGPNPINDGDGQYIEFSASAPASDTFGPRIIGARETPGSGGLGYLAFATHINAQVERMRITDSGNIGIGTNLIGGGLVVMNGNVGIGTWKPNRLLEVGSGIPSTIDTTNNRLVVLSTISSADTSGRTLSLSNFNSPFNGAGELFSYNYTSSVFDPLYISGSSIILGDSTRGAANVGIGTSSPANKFAVLGNVGIAANGGDSYLTTAAPSGGMIVEGNVGIGSTVPGQKLDVMGDIRGSGFSTAGTGEIVCVKVNGSLGTCSIGVVGVTCTCS